MRAKSSSTAYSAAAPPTAKPNTSSPTATPVDAAPDLVDHAGRLAAVTSRQLDRHDLAQRAAAHLPVDRVDAGGAHGDPDLARAGVRLLDVGDLQDLGVAVLGELTAFMRPTLLTAERRPGAALSARRWHPSVNGSRVAPDVSIQIERVSVYSRSTSSPFSRPMPLAPKPPNGTLGADHAVGVDPHRAGAQPLRRRACARRTSSVHTEPASPYSVSLAMRDRLVLVA